MNPTVQFFAFIAGFVIILLLFVRLIQLAEKRWSGKIERRRQSRIEVVIIAGIILGIAMMFQPWTVALFEPGFLLLLFSALAFTLWSHVLPKPAPAETKAGEEVH
jgi:protein-S-isoprenylcysteine O-methyltransferase Ste14